MATRSIGRFAAADRWLPAGPWRPLIALLALLAACATLALPDALARPAPAPIPVVSLRQGVDGLAACALENAVLTPSGLTLGTDASFRAPATAGGAPFGLCVSPPLAAPAEFDRVAGMVTLQGGGAATLEVRASPDGATWTVWHELPASGDAVDLPDAGTRLQYRLTLLDPAEQPPLVTALSLDLSRSAGRLHALDLGGSAALDKKSGHPTVRLFATREGLSGHPTANGHMIKDHDHFAALPSKTVLNPKDGNDYQVKISYNGHSATVPIWDVGPWNTRDNYWDADRDLFGDLPRYWPQAMAAWKDGYNGGRDQYGRWVTFPASIDIADGTYWDDLKMGVADFVDVTFLWVNDKSPPKTPSFDVYFKPPPANQPQAPAPDTVWFFAEGSTKAPFDTWLLVQNPGSEPARVSLTLMKTDGTSEVQDLVVAPTSRTSLRMQDLIPDSEFSTRIDASAPVYVERTMWFRHDGHSVMGIAAPSRTWYLAEGTTQDSFDTWILMQNPGTDPASVSVTFMKEDGSTQVLPMTVWPTSRLSLYTNAVIPNATFSTRIESDQPLVVERTTYQRGPQGGGDAAPGVPAPSMSWYFAEGNTRPGLDTWLLIQNPGDKTATANVTFYRDDGTTLVQPYTIGPSSRFSLDTRTVLDGARFGMKVEANQPVVAERTVYFGDDGSGQALGWHDSVGSTTLARDWFFPDGNTHDTFQDNLLVTNPQSSPANLRVRFMDTNATVQERTFVVPPTSRFTINVNAQLPDAELAAEVTSDIPVVVEESLYLASMSGGTSTIGVPQP